MKALLHLPFHHPPTFYFPYINPRNLSKTQMLPFPSLYIYQSLTSYSIFHVEWNIFTQLPARFGSCLSVHSPVALVQLNSMWVIWTYNFSNMQGSFRSRFSTFLVFWRKSLPTSVFYTVSAFITLYWQCLLTSLFYQTRFFIRAGTEPFSSLSL